MPNVTNLSNAASSNSNGSNSHSSTPSLPTTAFPPHVDPAVEVRTAVERVQADVDAVSEADLLSVSIDVMGGVMQALAAWSSLPSLFDAMERNKDIDVASIRKLRDYALALSSRQSDYARALAPSPLAPQQAQRGVEMRARAMVDLEALVAHGLLDAALIAPFGGNSGYKKVAQDLLGISNLVHESWPKLQGKTLLTLEDMDAAAKLSTSILESAAIRDRSPSAAAEITVLRDKTYTLFIRTYDEARRAVRFLRWKEDDADQILPSLYASRGNRKRASEDEGAHADVANVLAPVAPSASSAAAPSSAPVLSSLIGTPAPGSVPRV